MMMKHASDSGGGAELRHVTIESLNCCKGAELDRLFAASRKLDGKGAKRAAAQPEHKPRRSGVGIKASACNHAQASQQRAVQSQKLAVLAPWPSCGFRERCTL